MQGIIYTVLSDMVIEKFGVLFWDQMLDDLKPSSEGCTPPVSNTTTMSYWLWWAI
ncbi:guanylate cyclase-related protein [Vibrio cholerae]|nr:hypothetical protein DN36_229 [Vibrio cholerae]BCK15805.1 hypothetical protein VCSRO45_3426 [Vibrio cholerae]GHW36088.1 guanylate cyclase-related protein [Vibrio cholerae]GHW36496.1 guanylate cyclase-related protein [Vibrio cholerae]GHW57774.1 guanylate cyclase-related protein [Vibrio cholerae]